jgi:hypothetical protein
MAEGYPLGYPFAEALRWGDLRPTPPRLKNEPASNVFVCMLTPMRTILSAAPGVLWKPKRNSMKILWRVLWSVVGGSYGPPARISIWVWPFPSGRRRAPAVTRGRGFEITGSLTIRGVSIQSQLRRAIQLEQQVANVGQPVPSARPRIRDCPSGEFKAVRNCV